MTASNASTGLILIVDDTPTNLEVISEALGGVGFDVAIAISGERALQQIERKPPDLILLDVMMPGMDGFETCHHLKKNSKTCDIPVIFMTALSDAESKVQALELGAVDYITKPFHEREVLARVKMHLQLYRLTQNLESQVSQRTVELQASQLRLIQNEKMSALGNLVAGVAHEINNPLSFISGNLAPALEYIEQVFSLLDLYGQKYPEPDIEIQEAIATIDLTYIRKDFPQLVGSMHEGVRRIQEISNSLRIFSRADSNRPVAYDLHDGIDSTLLVLKHRLKANEHRPEINVITHYGNLPLVECFAGQLNQVFMNLLANAIDALEESNQGHSFAEIQSHPNQILVKTALSDDQQQAVIQVKDNGIGMIDEVRQRVFDHLYTTKSIGKGTGLGLAIAHQIVVEKHAGTIAVTSQWGQGTEFVVTIPIKADCSLPEK